MKSNTCKFAEVELSILSKSATDTENRPIIEPFKKEILELCDKFGKSGQSGGSAPYVATSLAQAIKKLCLQEPICPIMGIDDEWVDVAEISDLEKPETLFQNKRCGAVFKSNDRSYYLDAISFKEQEGRCYFSNGVHMPDGSKVGSRQFIKSFPFTPKTFYIDIIEKEVAKDDWEFYIKDVRQLSRVFRYYDVLTPKI